MKTWAAFVLIPIILCVTGCEKHSLSDLEKVDPGVHASPTPGQ